MHHLTRAELKELVLAISNPRHRLLIKVAFWHGLRVSEAINLKQENIRDGYITVKRLKGSLKTVQPFQSSDDPVLDEAVELRELAGKLKPGERLFDISRRGVGKLLERMGAKTTIPRHKLHPHVLKHSIAMQTIHSAGIENVRQWLGHKTMSSTGSYLRVTDEAAASAVHKAMSGNS